MWIFQTILQKQNILCADDDCHRIRPLVYVLLFDTCCSSYNYPSDCRRSCIGNWGIFYTVPWNHHILRTGSNEIQQQTIHVGYLCHTENHCTLNHVCNPVQYNRKPLQSILKAIDKKSMGKSCECRSEHTRQKSLQKVFYKEKQKSLKKKIRGKILRVQERFFHGFFYLRDSHSLKKLLKNSFAKFKPPESDILSSP